MKKPRVSFSKDILNRLVSKSPREKEKTLQILFPYASLNMCGLEGFEVGDLSTDSIGTIASDGVGSIAVSEQLGQNETQQAVTGLGRTPSSCYPQQKLKPEDLLPAQESKAIQEFNIAQPIGEGILADVNLLDAGAHIGINTVGQSLRNANLQLRSEPPNPQVNVSPWSNTTIGPDLPRRPLEINESCSVSA